MIIRGIKISELTEYIDAVDDDFIAIVDSNNMSTKKISKKNLLKEYIEYSYKMKISEKIPANSELELPFYYKVGADVLDVYYLGEKLIKDTPDVEGHYQEVGEEGTISNKIKVGWDVDEETADDDSYFEFVVRGKYEGGEV